MIEAPTGTKPIPILDDAGNETPAPEAKFEWSIQSGCDWWTDDPAEIRAMSGRVIVAGILRRGELLMIVGGAKTWKTWVALNLALSIDSGRPFLESYETVPGRVLYLDYELKAETLRKRMCMSSREAPSNLHFQSLRGLKKTPSLDEVTRVIEDGSYDVVFVDALYMSGWISEENSNDEIARDMRAIQKLANDTGVSVILVDHTAKGGGKDRDIMDAARGASAKGGIVDGVLQLVPFDGNEPGLVSIKTRVRDFPPAESDPVVKVAVEGHRLTISPTDLKASACAEEKNGQRILSHLSEFDDADMMDLKTALGLSDTPIRNAVNRLVSEGKVCKFVDPSHSQKYRFKIPDLAEQ